MKKSEVEEFLKSKIGYQKWGTTKLALYLKVSEKVAKNALKKVKNENKSKEIQDPELKYNKSKFKRLFWDIETSPNIVFSWNIGNKISINHDSIIKERAIICICYKWAGESKVHSLQWNNGNDKSMLEEFIKVLNSADESIGHNSDAFDLKWLKGRCIYHDIPTFPSYNTVDTLKLARSGFRFNSNRLDYLGKFFGYGGKADTGGFQTWKSIVLDNDTKAMDTMVKYCKIDVVRLEQVYDRLNPYTKAKVHVGVILGGTKESCPNCASDRTKNQGFRYLASGAKKQCRLCLNCGKNYTLPNVIKE